MLRSMLTLRGESVSCVASETRDSSINYISAGARSRPNTQGVARKRRAKCLRKCCRAAPVIITHPCTRKGPGLRSNPKRSRELFAAVILPNKRPSALAQRNTCPIIELYAQPSHSEPRVRKTPILFPLAHPVLSFSSRGQIVPKLH